MLDYDSCIKIINRLTPIFTKDVNIIGLDGIIIASSNKKRENTYHEAARISASSNRNIIITTKNMHMYRGCKCGVNMPITYNNKVIGVVGITGTAEEVIPYGPLIKELVQMIINEIGVETPQKAQKNNEKMYFKEIIQGIQKEDLESYKTRAKLLEIDMKVSRKMVVFKMCNNYKNNYKKIEDLFNKYLSSLNVLVLNLNNEKIVLLFNNNIDIKSYINDLISKMKLSKTNNYIFIIGKECKEILEYERAYYQISLVESIEVGNNFKKVIDVNEYSLKLLIKGISSEYRNRYIEDYYYEVFEGKNKASNEMLKTIKGYFINDMKIGETAKMMYVHRNTIMYRLNKLKKMYGIDITKPYECTKIYLAILIYEENIRKIESDNNK
ncbi:MULTISPECIES: CdaR family transcriptional regulator [Clostridium]|uniref:CdaR family transcriptional regulator n=1 Tax=Clostridium TaxID=1485 RepID=UPI00115A9594|nr:MULTISPECIES: sugar diacid recognition domain-containing protein [Clostridium]MBS5307584.1 helix-turn-helix domain-containing protein [Clostridium sp.]MDB1931844.1 helix-turn-helix domain-containing protein [Clostridium tertium]MDB1935468.1 helix-turn-helix domain-containing protein [Clostridium tertium]MDB1945532.1 helix-turn-helix domain-containing protein [Clostridium tertium]MDB1951275.1 helix-turn-helix domain-containing protein [Clostridium tertium]